MEEETIYIPELHAEVTIEWAISEGYCPECLIESLEWVEYYLFDAWECDFCNEAYTIEEKEANYQCIRCGRLVIDSDVYDCKNNKQPCPFCDGEIVKKPRITLLQYLK